MAHLRDISARCAVCGKTATVQLFNTFNAPGGRYCQRHGEQARRELQQREDAAAQREREQG